MTRARAIRLAAGTLDVPEQAISVIEQIKGGLTNESWRIATADTEVVVRISTGDEQALQIDRHSECRILAEVERAGIGPEVIACRPREHVLITRYIPGPVWTGEEPHSPVNIHRMAELLRKLHFVNVQQDIAVIHLPAILENYWNTLAARGRTPSPGSDRATLLRIATTLSGMSTQCLCHNDVHHLNVVDTGRLWLIDWEYAGVGSPWFDLASVCCSHGFTPAEARLLLSCYEGREDAASLETLQEACRLFNHIRDLWIAVRGS